MKKRNGAAPSQLIVRSLTARSQIGWLTIEGLCVPCALGRSGKIVRKREGDGATPVGSFPLRFALYRADRMLKPVTGLPIRTLSPFDGWCDDTTDRRYNCLVRHPYPASAEQLWRADNLYDVIVVIGHNYKPRLSGAGSAIFLHVARDGLKPTEGCIAVKASDMRKVMARLRRNTRLWIF